MAELNPPGGLLLVTSQEIADQESIAAEGFQGGVTWEWTIEGIPPARLDPGDAFDVTEGSTSLTVAYVPDPTLFPFTIRYLTPDGEPVEIDDWNDLPAPVDAPEIVKLEPDEIVEHVEYELSVTASGLDDQTGEPTQAGGTYTLRILANYSINRDLLTDAIDARR